MKHRPLLGLVFGLVLGLAAGVLGTGLADQPATAQSAAAPLTTGTFAKLADAVKPAVINVNTEGKRGAGRTQLEQHFGDENFRRFFGDMPERPARRSLGSGASSMPRA